ncbi:hypothetical protein MP228_013059 [Amoeboaphelidium protococcarum]|nr:hypothetical protein MP228_013059 [Amoeboaphelidium protococcarum]
MLRTTRLINRGAVQCQRLYSSLQTEAQKALLGSKRHPEIEKRVHDIIVKNVSGNPLVVFMKGSPSYPQCGFSRLVIQILNLNGVPMEKIKALDVLDDADLRQGVKLFSQWPTIPQVYIGGEFVGGSDILRNMHETGELQQLLKQHKLLDDE